MNEARQQSRAGASILLFGFVLAGSPGAQGAHVHAKFHDAQQWIQRQPAGKLGRFGRRDKHGGGKGIRRLEGDYFRVPPARELLAPGDAHGAKLIGEGRGFIGFITMSHHDSLLLFLIQLKNHHLLCVCLLANHGGQLSK
jgi:hypothetical protein